MHSKAKIIDEGTCCFPFEKKTSPKRFCKHKIGIHILGFFFFSWKLGKVTYFSIGKGASYQPQIQPRKILNQISLKLTDKVDMDEFSHEL